MHKRTRALIVSGAVALPLLLIAGCPTSSEGIDLTERGELTMVITRASESTIATATAQVMDSGIIAIADRKITLADDQILSINEVPLTATTLTDLGLDTAVAAVIEAVEDDEEYTIEFDNQGTKTMIDVSPPEDFAGVEPDRLDEVDRGGFDIVWDASNDDTLVSVVITGQIYAYLEDGSLGIVEGTLSLPNLPDDGELSIGAAELNQFINGDITVTLTREMTISQKLGFTEGTFYLRITLETPLTLAGSGT